jgi:hypothetical protein
VPFLGNSVHVYISFLPSYLFFRCRLLTAHLSRNRP